MNIIIAEYAIPKETNELSIKPQTKKTSKQKNKKSVVSNEYSYSSQKKKKSEIEIDTSALGNKVIKQKIYKNSWTITDAEKKEIGDLGEIIIMNEEKAKLIRLGLLELKPKHVSKMVGDGLGYDIESYNTNGDKIYIEVKTTRGSSSKFYITPNEYRTMLKLKPMYFIKRVSNIDVQSKTYEIETISASVFIENFKLIPSNFIAVRKNNDSA